MRDRSGLVGAILLVLAGALVYLPLTHKIGYSHDDWYLMASARAEGADVFHDIYSVDRPLRAYVLASAYTLFGQNVLFYNLSAWLFRVLSALLFLWLLRMLWPAYSRWTLLMATLYLIYPGFLSQHNGIDYQSQILSLALAMLSVALTVVVYFQKNMVRRVLGICLAVLSGILYLGLVEYEAGFELMRLTILFILAGRVTFRYREKIIATIKMWIPYSLILFGFGFWRVFIFQSDRKATDVGFQFEQLTRYPLQTVFGWFIQIIQDLFDITIAAWVIPFAQLTNFIQRWGGILAIMATGLMLIALQQIKRSSPQADEPQSDNTREALLLGIFTAIGGLIPIVLVNREVSFPLYSRYSVVSSVGAAIFIVAVLTRLNGKVLRDGILAGLCFISILTHHANAVKHAQESEQMNSFWWQVSWRVPQFEKNTTLIANYPSVAIEEDYFVWGPANLVYYPESQNPEVIQPGLFASVLNEVAVTKVLTRERQEYDNRRSIITYKNYRNIIVLSQPDLGSCVHVINGSQPEYSINEPDSIRLIGSYSEVEHVLVDESPHAPPEIVFGPEPPRGWCYYYQKADLARQHGDWESIVGLGNEAQEQGLVPLDAIEWIPFLEAYATMDDIDRLTELAPVIAANPYIALQACQILGAASDLSEQVREAVDTLYCLE